jgi:hypothetical protein
VIHGPSSYMSVDGHARALREALAVCQALGAIDKVVRAEVRDNALYLMARRG